MSGTHPSRPSRPPSPVPSWPGFLRAVAQSMARELGPQNIHVAHLVIDSGVDTAWVRQRRRERGGNESIAPDELMNPSSIAETYWQLHLQPRDAWTHELDLRPYRERW